MRKRKKNAQISVNAIAGTHVVLLGLDATDKAREGLVGFTIKRMDHKNKKTRVLASSDERPIQRFMWGDYEAYPGISYTYMVSPVYLKNKKLAAGPSVDLKIKTENPDDGTHAVYFNRGVAGSQGFSRKFGDYRRWYLTQHSTPGDETTKPRQARATEYIKPEDIPADKDVYGWLSRGLEEAMLGFIGKAKNSDYSIRAAVYEFTHIPAIHAFVEALERGADVKIVHHAKRQNVYTLKQNYNADNTTSYTIKKDGKEIPDPNKASKLLKNREALKLQVKDSVATAADQAMSHVGLRKPEDPKEARKLLKRFDSMMIERKITQISHNKFIVLLHKGKPVEVWTGSTNFTGGGIYGQSNVGHVVRDPQVAKKYFAYWKKLSTDPKKRDGKNDPPNTGIQNWTVNQQPDLKGPQDKPIIPVFSPRLPNKKGSMLDWYAERLDGAEHSVFFTSAFSVAQQFMDILTQKKQVKGKEYTGTPYQRYLLLEGVGGLLKDKYPALKACPQNRVAWGETLRTRSGHEELLENLTGLNDHVNYLHTKYMLVDPLSDDPIVISGSANFSTASTESNDENMLIIRGNTRVADIYLGEFMRLFNHFHSRNVRNTLSDAEYNKYMKPKLNDSWTGPYYDPESQEYHERKLFA